MIKRRRDRTREFRFDRTALLTLAACIAALYGAALSEAVGWLPQRGWLGEHGAYARAATWPTAWRVREPAEQARGTAPWLFKAVDSVGALIDLFRQVDYQLEAVRTGEQPVPRVVIERMPADLHGIEPAAQRKRVFIKLILPLVLFVNERILADRGRLAELREDVRRFGRIPDPRDRAWLNDRRERYGVEVPGIEALLRRIDVIPPSLAVAQAAVESGWGTSRFVREGNAIFGQRTFAKGAGLVPSRRGEGETHEVRSFGRLLDSVAGYMFNLNSHYAYAAFRQARERQRMTRGILDGHALASTLERYSELRGAYVQAIREIIESGNLRALDRARLGDGAVTAGSDRKA